MTGSAFYTAAGTTTLTVPINTPVTWENGSSVLHDVTFETPSAAQGVSGGGSGNIPLHSSGSNRRQFATPGNYAFHCQQHAPGMVGTVIVQ